MSARDEFREAFSWLRDVVPCEQLLSVTEAVLALKRAAPGLSLRRATSSTVKVWATDRLTVDTLQILALHGLPSIFSTDDVRAGRLDFAQFRAALLTEAFT